MPSSKIAKGKKLLNSIDILWDVYIYILHSLAMNDRLLWLKWISLRIEEKKNNQPTLDAHKHKTNCNIRGVTKYKNLQVIDWKVAFLNSKNVCFYQLPL